VKSWLIWAKCCGTASENEGDSGRVIKEAEVEGWAKIDDGGGKVAEDVDGIAGQ
jgi:hypothetical protein